MGPLSGLAGALLGPKPPKYRVIASSKIKKGLPYSREGLNYTLTGLIFLV